MPRTTNNTQRHAAQPVRRACCAEQFCVAKAPSGSYSVEKLIDGRSAFADGRLRSGNVQKNAFASSDATCPVRRTYHASARRAACPMRAHMHHAAYARTCAASRRHVARHAARHVSRGARPATCHGVCDPRPAAASAGATQPRPAAGSRSAHRTPVMDGQRKRNAMQWNHRTKRRVASRTSDEMPLVAHRRCNTPRGA